MRTKLFFLCFVIVYISNSILLAGSTGSSLAAPTNLSATDAEYDDKIKIAWDKSSGAKSYNIYRNVINDNTSSILIASTNSTKVTDSGIEPGQIYYYWVRALDNNNQNPEISPFSNGDAGFATLPAPGGLSASNGELTDTIRLSWGSVNWATSYEIYRSESKQTNSAGMVGASAETIFYDTAIEAEKEYYYWVKARSDISGFTNVSDFSGSAVGSASVAVELAPPSGLSATDGMHNDKIEITWDPVTNATGYEIFRYDKNQLNKAEQVASVSTTSFDDANIEAGETYYYWVRAIYQNGDALTYSEFSNPDDGFAEVFVPEILESPTGLAASDGEFTDKIRISWQAVENATNYSVYRNTTLSESKAHKIETTSDLEIYDDKIKAGTDYYYWIAAEFQHEKIKVNSGFSEPDLGFAGLQSPYDLDASDGDYLDKIKLSWKYSGKVDNYLLFRNEHPDIADAQLIYTGASKSFIDEDLSSHLQYYYFVKAQYESVANSIISESSNIDSGFAGIPEPSGLEVSKGKYDFKIDLSWKNNNMANYYILYRSESPDLSAASVISETTLKKYSDENIEPAIVYYYWLEAVHIQSGQEYKTIIRNPVAGFSRLPVPINVKASKGEYNDRIKLKWESVKGVEEFEVFRNTENKENGAALIMTTSKHVEFDNNVVSGEEYFYWVRVKREHEQNLYYSDFSEPDIGFADGITGITDSDHPERFVLYQNYPNPFNPETRIKYDIAEAGRVKLQIFDILGREILTLVDEYQTTGSYIFEFDAGLLLSGTYIYRITAKDFGAAKKMVLLR